LTAARVSGVKTDAPSLRDIATKTLLLRAKRFWSCSKATSLGLSGWKKSR
jgi:hypothetical protein